MGSQGAHLHLFAGAARATAATGGVGVGLEPIRLTVSSSIAMTSVVAGKTCYKKKLFWWLRFELGLFY